MRSALLALGFWFAGTQGFTPPAPCPDSCGAGKGGSSGCRDAARCGSPSAPDSDRCCRLEPGRPVLEDDLPKAPGLVVRLPGETPDLHRAGSNSTVLRRISPRYQRIPLYLLYEILLI